MARRSPDAVKAFDLNDLHRATRLVLTHDIITENWPRKGALRAVLPWVDFLHPRLRDLLGYRLEASARHVRLIRTLDLLDASQRDMFKTATKPPRIFDRRRIAYLCLVLSIFQRSRVEIDLVDLVKAFTPLANQIDGLGFEPTIAAHKKAIVDVVEWLISREALRLSEGSVQAWASNDRNGDALFDIDHDICSMLFRPERPLQHIDSVQALLAAVPATANDAGGAADAQRRARRLLVERPVVYFHEVDPSTAEALQSRSLASDLHMLTGLVAEYRAEGVMLTDPGGWYTDERFPHRPSSVNRAAGLLASVLVEQISSDESAVVRMPAPALHEASDDLVVAADQARAADGSLTVRDRPAPATVLLAPFISSTQLSATMTELYAELGEASFGSAWRHDPQGLLQAAIPRLVEMRLADQMPGGLLLLPLAARYRQIINVARTARDQQLALTFPEESQ